MKLVLLLLSAFVTAAVGCGRGDSPSNRTGADARVAVAEVTPTKGPAAGDEGLAAPEEPPTKRVVAPDDVERVSVGDARRRVQAGQALLVCAYEGEERFQQVALEGAISYEAFQQRLSSLTTGQEIIFY